MKKMKKVAAVLLCILFAVCILSGVSLAAGGEGDPADSYKVQTAPKEDKSISLWFEHSFKKVLTGDTAHSGMDTYSAYMAKNEVENIQFVLYSDTDKAGMGATVTSFKDSKGNEISAELYYEMYVTVSDIREEFVLGANSSNTPIREGETPDPVYPLAKIGGKFKLNAKKSQAFFIKLRTAEDTPSGWYCAQLDITNSAGEVVKTATVFCYVWDFALSEATEFQTAMYLSNDTTYGGTYKQFYDYLLDNRLVAMDPPGGISSDNEYLTNPRVNAVRVTYGGGGSEGSYGEVGTAVEYYRYLDIYNDLSMSEKWEDIKDKLYFYTADEPVGAVWNKLTGSENMTVDDVKTFYGHLETFWEAPLSTVPYHENHPYPYFHYTGPMEGYKDYEKMDATQAMLEDGGIAIWCPQVYAFTPASELSAAGYKGMNGEPVRELSATISNLYTFGSNNSAEGTVGKDLFYGTGYYNWNSVLGEFSDRIYSAMAVAKEKSEVANSRLWTYGAGGNYCYTYANHLIENTGLQTKMFFWQCYQNDVTGYLYYGTNSWREVDIMNGTDTVDSTVTGSNTMCQWRTNKLTYGADTFYGNGVLFYGATQAKIRGVSGYVGSLRVELMRDGIEEYQMLKMLESLKGEAAAKEVVSRVSANVVRYLSLPGFDRSAYSASLDDYDVMELVRRSLGNAVESAEAEDACDHRWDSGKVVKEAGCLTVGRTVYGCTLCDAEYDEVIPAKHTAGDCFKKVSGKAATCTEDGSEIYACRDCGYRKTVETKAFHDDPETYRCEPYSEKAHSIYCSVCDERLGALAHESFYRSTATCEDAGELCNVCALCGYSESLGIATEAKGHSYENGVCTVCGGKDGSEEPSVTLGDVNGDGKINSIDTNMMKRLLSGAASATEEQSAAADVTGDGKVNSYDTNKLKRFISGTISEL